MVAGPVPAPRPEWNRRAEQDEFVEPGRQQPWPQTAAGSPAGRLQVLGLLGSVTKGAEYL